MASGHNAIVALATQASDSYGDAVNASEWIVDSAVLPDVVRATTRPGAEASTKQPRKL
jgi:hypothetical protein